MKKNKILKIILLFCLLGVFFIQNYAMAESSILGDLDQYAQKQEVSTKFQDKVGIILGAFQTGGSILAIICLAILGIKYMLGSVEEKAEYKKTLAPYALGACMVFGISNLLNIVYKIATSF